MAPSSERWRLWLLAKCLSLYCEVDIMVALCLASKCRGCVVFERGVVYSRLLYCPKSSLEVSLCGKSCADKLMEILLCEGGDVELDSNLETNLGVCV